MFRKGIAVLLALLVFFFTVLSLLAIWDIIEIQHIIRRSLSSLFIIFVSSVVMLFIFSVLYKGGDQNNASNPSN